MIPNSRSGGWTRERAAGALAVACLLAWCANAQSDAASASPVFRLVNVRNGDEAEDVVRLSRNRRPPKAQHAPADLQVGDRLFTGVRVTAQLTVVGATVREQFIRLDGDTQIEILADAEVPSLRVTKGRLWYSSASGAERLVIETSANATIEPIGTEYALAVAPGGASDDEIVLTMIEGDAEVTPADGRTLTFGPMTRGSLAGGRWTSEPLPEDPRAAVVALNQDIQWALYYPAILDLEELPGPWQDDPGLSASLRAYRKGNLLAALKVYPRVAPAPQAEAVGPEVDLPMDGRSPEEQQTDSALLDRDGDSRSLRPPSTEGERLYQAALLLAVGRLEEVKARLAVAKGAKRARASNEERIIDAFRVVVAAVLGESVVPEREPEPKLVSEWLAESYFQQSLAGWSAKALTETAPVWEQEFYGKRMGRLERARFAARKAHALSTNRVEPVARFGFAAVRLAELEFSFGRHRQAEEILQPVLDRTRPEAMLENAQAWALNGFLLSARNRIGRPADSVTETESAFAAFGEAIRLDPGLGNGWLGQGLCCFRTGRVTDGVRSIQRAVAAEPNRAFLRSYLGKAYDEAAEELTRFWRGRGRGLRQQQPEGENWARFFERKAASELTISGRLDPGDPTRLLYSALLKRKQNRINAAVRDLEESIRLNQNRAVYRSSFLLDQDRAVRGVALAQVYRDAGMNDVAVREASRSVNADYGNAAAHLFLASSYDALRDPRQVNLRYETPWLNELLLANLMKPVGAGPLSSTISQQEYGQLFESPQWGIYSGTEYRSRGDWQQAGSIYGWVDRFAYSLDTFYSSVNGYRPNEDQENLTLWAKAKFQMAPQDGLLVEVIYSDREAGDLVQYYDPNDARKDLRITEKQEPIVLAGYQHEWSPGNRTLFLAARLDDTLTLTDTASPNTWLARTGGIGTARWSTNVTHDTAYRGDFDGYSFELQQIWRAEPVRLGGAWGVRYQFGEFPVQEELTQFEAPPFIGFAEEGYRQEVSPGFDRFSVYGYNTWACVPEVLWLTAGLSYDTLDYPVNHRFVPVTAAEDRRDLVAPKAGVIWQIDDASALQAAYSRWLGGVSFDQSFRLEPSQVAGIIQNYRDLLPASELGSVAAPETDLVGAVIDRRFPTQTYAGLGGQWSESRADQFVGAFAPPAPFAEAVPTGRWSRARYRERSLWATVDQLLHEQWALNLRYRVTDSSLGQEYAEPPNDHASLSSVLHELGATARWNHPTGLFAAVGATWYSQANSGFEAARPGDDFWQVDAEVGYRLLRRRLEVRAGVLNLTDEDYRLTSLTPHAEFPRDRTFFASLKLNF